MTLRKCIPSSDIVPSACSTRVNEYVEMGGAPHFDDVDLDHREVYFLIMHFLKDGPCKRTFGQFENELLEHQLLPRRYHARYSRIGSGSGDANDNGVSFPLDYKQIVERHPHIEKDHLVKLLKQLILSKAPPLQGIVGGNAPNAADVPTLLGTGSFSLLKSERDEEDKPVKRLAHYLRWPHTQANQVHGLSLREIGGGFAKHQRAPSIRGACYTIAKPSTMVQKMQNIKKIRGHRNAVYCAIFDGSGRYVITGSDDRLVKIWSMETAFCLASCRGHEGDITDLAVSSNNTVVASASNDFIIRVWRLPDGMPISVLRGHTGAVTAIAFSPRPFSIYHLLSSSDDGTCRIWDARYSQPSLRIYLPKPSDASVGKSNGPSSCAGVQNHQILCCAYNSSGTVFVTGSSDTSARVWNACKSSTDDPDQPNHEMDVLAGHENDVNYVQFSGCAVTSRSSITEASKEENLRKFKTSWFAQDNIVTCSRDGSAIIWIPRSRRSHGKVGRWTRAYHLKVPPPPMPPQISRGGPRQRLLPTPRGVNMIVWSLDNRFVLAAIMDCRICVWNAVDGSLVHSLTGHSESTYVLDVHPFNPRIAMSAGYDGKTIVWDIWEGTPIHIYEIGRFKLVDGKFSPDGTSIVLSDDVGQIYIINTGQGDSLKDAEYDQFFLGDYRPLVQDTHGNVLDQETQLVPYRRNIQDLLCDSSMIPYPEPYQSMYQRRRLGALGIEWRPTSVNLAVGPGDISGFLDYHIPPLADLDTFFEPLPEFIDAMEWEPEIEIQSDDNDSEYNVTDEYSSELEREGLSNGSYGDPECSAEDSETREDFRRSKRKKHRASDAEIMTSSGRRVKRRNLDERDSTLPLCNKTRKSKHKSSKRKSLKSKSSRPQRVAARNALNFFSRIGEASTDEEDEDNSESDSSDSESMVQELNIHSGESDRAIHKSLRGKEMLFDESVHAIKHSESQVTGGSKMRLVVKFSARSANNIVPPNDCDKQLDLNPLRSQDPGPSARDGEIENRCEGEVEDRIVEDMSAGYMDSKIRWGEVKARTSKRLRLGEPMKMETLPEGLNTTIDNDNSIGNTEALPAGPNTPLDSINRILNNVNHNLEPKSEPASGTQSHGDKRVFMAGNLEGERNEEFAVHQRRRVESPFTGNGNVYKEYANCMDYDEPLKDGGDYSQHVQERELPINENLRFKSKIIWKNSGTPPIAAGENCGSSGYNLEHRSSLESSISGVPEENAGLSESSEDHENRNGFENLEARTSRTRLTNVQDTKKLHSDTNRKMYNAVYKRSKSYRARADSEGDGGGMEESTSNANNRTRDPRTDCSEGATNGIRTRSMGIKIAREPNSFFEARGDPPGSVGTSNRGEKLSLDTHEMLWRSNSKLTVGLRSTRNRRGSNFESDINSSVKKVSHDPMKKLSWMLLTEHEEFYRYIPQQGDEVAYLRQGHEQYLEWHRSKEKGPWRTLKGNLKDVEFCKVIDLDYSTVPGSGDSCCKITFEFIDSSSTVFGKTFQMTLLELNNFPDFIVERARYDSAISRNWTNRDKCQVWWRNGVGEGGSWWEGRIVSVKAQSLDFPESPWERFHVKYKNDSTGDHEHSPWEFHDPGSTWEHPRIDGWSKNTLISSFAELEQSRRSIKRDYYGIQKLKQVWQKSDFYNRFPVPLTFETINSRLENNYYRTLEAVKHDFGVMLGNAESYFGKSMELGTKLKQLSKWFDETMSTVTPIEADN